MLVTHCRPSDRVREKKMKMRFFGGELCGTKSYNCAGLRNLFS